MKRIHVCNPFSRGWAMSLALGLGLTSAQGSKADQMPITVESVQLTHPMLLDQKGRPIPIPSGKHAGAIALPKGLMPTYVAYKIGGNGEVPSGLPRVDSGPIKGQWKPGPLHLDPLIKEKLDTQIGHYGAAAVQTKHSNYLVERLIPVSPNANASGTASLATSTVDPSGKAWLVTTGTGSKAQPAKATQPQAQTLVPPGSTEKSSPAIKPRVNNPQPKKSADLLTKIKDTLTLDNLKKQLNLNPPKIVTTQPKPQAPIKTLAQELASTSEGGTPRPAPVPEPGTIIVFGVFMGGWGVRRMLQRKAVSATA